jgi:hypothetical protein
LKDAFPTGTFLKNGFVQGIKVCLLSIVYLLFIIVYLLFYYCLFIV